MSSLTMSKSARFYRNHEPVPSNEEIADARKRMENTVPLLNSIIAEYAASVLTIEYTSAVDTLAVTLLPDGFSAQLVNPEFALSLKSDLDLAFVRTHEMYHLILQHLLGDREVADPGLHTLAQEAVINDRVQALFFPDRNPKNRPMPVQEVDGKDKETGVNPYKLWEKYRSDLRSNDQTPVPYVEFMSSDLRCYVELLKMSKRPKPAQCETAQALEQAGPPSGGQGGEPGDSSGEGKEESKGKQKSKGKRSGKGQDESGLGGGTHIDKDALGPIAEETLERAVRKVSQNPNANREAKNELIELMESTGDSDRASQLWGDLGAGVLRGETAATRKVEYWRQFVGEQLSSRLTEGMRLIYNQAIWWSPRLGRKGDEELRHVLLAVDTSGSMQTKVLEHVADLLGEEDGLSFEFLAFDAEVYPFTLGEGFHGGGGTRFDIIDEYVQEHDSTFDAILVVTDGYAPAFTPVEPDKWVWLITPGGNTWPEDHDPAMSTCELDIVDV